MLNDGGANPANCELINSAISEDGDQASITTTLSLADEADAMPSPRSVSFQAGLLTIEDVRR